MNFNDILQKILDIAGYPQEKREQFVRDFYNYYFSLLVGEIGGIDPSFARQLITALDKYKENPDLLNSLWAQLENDVKMKEIANRVANEVLGEIMDDFGKNASEEQKRQLQDLVNQGSAINP